MLLQLERVNKYYGSFHAVKDLSFSLEEGKIYGILGRNGAGKTTTLRMIMEIYYPEQGEIKRFFKNSEVSYLPEERGLYPKMTVAETIDFFGQIKGMSRKEIRANAGEWLEHFDLGEWKDKKVEALSKGMQQKVQFIITAMNTPRFLILDEPFSGLDPLNIQLFKDEIVSLMRRGTTVLFSTHIMEHAENICNHVIIIDKGKKVVDGEMSRVKEEYGKMNIFIRYSGDGRFLRNGMEESVDDYGTYAEVVLKKREDYPDYLRAVAARLDLSEFRVDLPSLKSIFLEAVGAKGDENEK
ncbi:MAG TPA: ATP-binding cassette domain-containing protein [Candidatus Mcinerneyibacteriales bacterium]|jgi:ABC-2 type transport system ATP-binding protein|nr:ATP-binding cassette domain-containing protein [Candidatus Mcinerneyibacteriales bacterium]HPE20425.1 ATP-binding cassette domain-containing protein [Candidatus Mcinerneyibacteriales bacterium]HPJ69404.1 ATP-binding cassette domain-containing protein [Candidatus Mcinerneyibacteriales bacterium]HPQ88673.1 ATP-binding cassette domain-containing protein [Candidatus Mcinerneyibacteriales bacterium]